MTTNALAKNILAIIIPLLVVTGCANQSFGLLDFLQRGRIESAYKKADELVLEGNPVAAASHLWKSASDLPSPHRQKMRIHATEILLDTDHPLKAYDYLSRIPEDKLDKNLLLKKRIGEARFYRHIDQPEKIIAVLPLNIVKQGNTPEKITALRLSARARIAEDLFISGIEWYLALHKLLDKQSRVQNMDELLDALLRLHPERASTELTRELPPDVRPWLELALLATPAETDREALEQQYAVWQKSNRRWKLPDSFSGKLRARWEYLDYYPEKVALLLPLTGPYVKFGKAVKDGFMESYQASSTPRFTVVVHNTDQSTDITTVYKKATLDDEVGLVIGPLLKPAVDALARSDLFSAPTITLNYASDRTAGQQGNLFQFGLSPEDEALQAARRIWDDGHRFIVVLTPDDQWGKRLYHTFADEYTELGGTIHEVRHYDPGFVDYASVIKSLFRIDQSIERHSLVSAALNEQPRFDPRIRDDITASMLFAVSKQATIIFPQMKFYYVDKLPTYATSHAYDPGAAARGRDLDGLIYCDIPAIVHRENFAGTVMGKYTRLRALGADAQKLVKRFRRMNLGHFPINGETGQIFIEENQHLFRRLPWARFQRGKPVPLHTL